MTESTRRCAIGALFAIFAAAPGLAQTAPEEPAVPDAGMIERGARFLLTVQAEDGSWAAEAGVGVSALVIKALAQTPEIGPKHPAVQRGVRYVLPCWIPLPARAGFGARGS